MGRGRIRERRAESERTAQVVQQALGEKRLNNGSRSRLEPHHAGEELFVPTLGVGRAQQPPPAWRLRWDLQRLRRARYRCGLFGRRTTLKGLRRQADVQ